jgi:nucleoside diphosphate kinase
LYESAYRGWAVLQGFKIVQSEEASLSAEQAETFYAEHKGKAFFENLIAFMTSGPVVKLILKKEGAIKAWRELLGPTNSLTAKAEAPRSLRSLYGIDGTQNAAHGSDSVESAAREIDLMFPQQSTLLMYKALTPADAATIDQQLMFGGFTVTEKEETELNDWEGAPLGVITKLIISKRGAVSAAAALTVAGCEFVYVSPNVAQAAADIDQIFPVQQTVRAARGRLSARLFHNKSVFYGGGGGG